VEVLVVQMVVHTVEVVTATAPMQAKEALTAVAVVEHTGFRARVVVWVIKTISQ
jgi:hypothetical protein